MSESTLERLGYGMIGADNHAVSRKQRIAQTPVSNVLWSGKRGCSQCYPTDDYSQKVLAQYNRMYVSYNLSAEPDFSFCSQASVKISNMSADRAKNFGSAEKRLLNTSWAKEREISNLSQFEEYRKKNNLTWHECSDGVTMQLVPNEINSRFGHSGGVAEHKEFDNSIDITSSRSIQKSIAKTKLYAGQGAVIVSQSLEKSIEAGKGAALVACTVSSLNNIAQVASGEKSFEDAAKDILTDTAGSFASAAGIQMTQDLVTQFAQNMGAEQLAKFASAPVPTQEIAMVVMTATTIERYLDGNISAEDCAFQLISSGMGALAYSLGASIGGPIGGILASTVMTQITITIDRYRQEKKIEKARDAEIRHVLSWAQAEMACQQDNLRDYVHEELGRWDTAIDSGFQTIMDATMANDADGIAAGLDTIMNLFDTQVKYKSLSEFEKDFFSDTSTVLTL